MSVWSGRVVDVVAEDGQGEAAVATLIRKRSRSRNGLAALAATRRRVHSITFQELLDVVQIWTDGACSGNPGPGGWGAVLRYGTVEKELCGGSAEPTTNNRIGAISSIRLFRHIFSILFLSASP